MRGVKRRVIGSLSTMMTRHGCSSECLDKMAAYASRYSLILEELKPFISVFYRSISLHKRNRFQRFNLTQELKWAMELWSVSIAYLKASGNDRSRSITSLIIRDVNIPDWFIHSDGAGFYISKSRLSEPIVAASYIYPERLPTSSYQNSSELIAIALGLHELRKRGCYGSRIFLIGDSTVALSWAFDEKFKEGRSQRTAIIMTMIRLMHDFRVVGIDQISSKDNYITDELSRGSWPNELNPSIRSTYITSTTQSHLFTCFDPRKSIECINSISDLINFYWTL
jgi:hypothetical protein